MQSDADIIQALRAGNRDAALTAFVMKHRRFVYGVAYRLLNNVHDAEDAMQEVFLRASRKLDTFKMQSTLQTWLYSITTNVCKSMIRKRRLVNLFALGEGQDERDVESSDVSPAHQVERSEFVQAVDAIIATLPAKQRETFCMRFHDELSYEEISKITGTSVGALKANYHWAIKKLAGALENTEHIKDRRS